MKVTAENHISEVLAGKKGAAEVFMSYGSHCLSCENTTFKTVADMSQKHQVDLSSLLKQLNDLEDTKVVNWPPTGYNNVIKRPAGEVYGLMCSQKCKDNLFEDFAADYDRMIGWEDRLRREEPFFKKLFQEVQAARVLDVACATGHHAIMFSTWGLQVAAADVSNDMICTARKKAQMAGREIVFKTIGLADVDTAFKSDFDAIVCVGNSLPHIKTVEELQQSFLAMANLLKPNGLLVLQIRNYQRVYARNERFMPLNTRVEGNKEYLYLRMNDLEENSVSFNIISLTKDEAGKWSYRVETERLKPWTLPDVEANLSKAGLIEHELFGDFAFGPFKGLESTDLIVVARKVG